MMTARIRETLTNEDGHADTLPGVLLGMAGFIMLGIGAANDTGWLAVAGGIVGAAGLLGWELLRHMRIDYGIFRRLDEREK